MLLSPSVCYMCEIHKSMHYSTVGIIRSSFCSLHFCLFSSPIKINQVVNQSNNLTGVVKIQNVYRAKEGT